MKEIKDDLKDNNNNNTKNISRYDSYSFMFDPNTNMLLDEDEVVSKMYSYAKYFSKKLGDKFLYRNKDLSFIAQIMRFTFLLLSVFSFFAALFVLLRRKLCNYDGFVLFLYYLVCFGISVILMVVTKIAAYSFSKSYVQEIGRLYNVSVMEKNNELGLEDK